MWCDLCLLLKERILYETLDLIADFKGERTTLGPLRKHLLIEREGTVKDAAVCR
jgi:hypothetical protein